MSKRLNLHWLSECRTELYGLAILWVMIFHGYDWNHLDYSLGISFLSPLQTVIKLGNSGVDIFLLLSGISLYFSFSKNDDLLPFYKKRYLRLYPAVWILNLPYWGALFIGNWRSVGAVGATSALLLRLTQLSFWFGGDKYIWYIAAMAVMYFMYPFVFRFLYDKPEKTGRRAALLIGLSIVLVLAFAYYPNRQYHSLYKLWEIALTRFPIFFLGCALGKAVKEKKSLSAWWLILPIACLALSFGLIHFVRLPRLKELFVWRYLLSLIGLGVTLLAAWLFHLVRAKPIHAFFAFFGRRSLEFYLAHRVIYVLYVAARARLLTGMPKTLTFAEYGGVLLLSVPAAMLCAKIEDWILPNRAAPKQAPDEAK